MAELARYEVAFRARTAADDSLLAFVVGERTDLTDAAQQYLPQVTAYTLEQLSQEPAQLHAEKERVGRDIEELACRNYGAFLENAEVVAGVRKKLSDLHSQFDEAIAVLLPIDRHLQSFQAQAVTMQHQRAVLRSTLMNHTQLLEVLELPQLLDELIRNQLFDDAIEVLVFSDKLFQSYDVPGKNTIPVLNELFDQVQRQREHFEHALGLQLRSELHLTQCFSVVGTIRRLLRNDEAAVRQLFMRERGEFVAQLRKQVEALQSSHSPTQCLRAASDLLRTHVFDIGMQYQAVFADSALLAAWLNEQVDWVVQLLRAHCEHPEFDLAAVAQVLRFVLHASSVLRRVGATFFPVALPIFENAVRTHVQQSFQAAVEGFGKDLERHDWTASTALSRGSEDPMLELTRHRPLAVLTNELLTVFNDLRQCAFHSLAQTVAQLASEAVVGGAARVRTVHPSVKPKDLPELRILCEQYQRLFVPLITQQVAKIYGEELRVSMALESVSLQLEAVLLQLEAAVPDDAPAG
jgi:hypothetical protein